MRMQLCIAVAVRGESLSETLRLELVASATEFKDIASRIYGVLASSPDLPLIVLDWNLAGGIEAKGCSFGVEDRHIDFLKTPLGKDEITKQILAALKSHYSLAFYKASE